MPLPGITKPPLWMAARAKSPADPGDARCAQTEAPPADWPASVTRAGSPPNAAMLRCTQPSAACWSRKPAFPEDASADSAVSAGCARKPKTPSR
jgi:hypothetical protein